MRRARIVMMAAAVVWLACAASARAQNLRYFGFVGNGDTETDLQRTKSFTNFAYTAAAQAYDAAFTARVQRMHDEGLKAIINLSFLWCEVPGTTGKYTLCSDYVQRWQTWRDSNRSILKPGYLLAFAVLDEPYPKLDPTLAQFDQASAMVKNDPVLRQADQLGTAPTLMMIESTATILSTAFDVKGGSAASVDWIGVDQYAIHPLNAPDYDAALDKLRTRFGREKPTVYVMDAFWDPNRNDYDHPGKLGSINVMDDVAMEWYQKASADYRAVALGGFAWIQYGDRATAGYCSTGGVCFPCDVEAAYVTIGRAITGKSGTHTPIGYLDTINSNGTASGWACDQDAPLACGRVKFYSGSSGLVTATIAAVPSEPAVNNLCGGGTAHRFVATLPAWTAGQSISARAVNLEDGAESPLTSLCAESPSCSWYRVDQCVAAPPVGAWNSTAYNTGYYDYLCGYYKYNYGYDPYGYCSQAVNYSNAAGIHTAGTGTCVNGSFYNYYAGLYDYYCRYYEYYNYGWDYGGYCTSAKNYASWGSCDRCGTTVTPTCLGTASVIWIQPQWRAGFGPPGSLVLAGRGSVTGTCNQPGGVDLYWRTPSMGYWTHVAYAAPVGTDGIWYNAIENANPYQTYYVYVTYQNGPAAYCTYDGRNDIVWCQ